MICTTVTFSLVCRRLPFVLTWVTAALVGSLRSQDCATTLLALTQRADAIVIAHTDGVATDDATHLELQFTTRTVLEGTSPGQFALTEPSGQCCGRALHGMTYGRYLLFLDYRGTRVQLTVSNSRSVLAATPELIAHVRVLLGATEPAEVVAALTRSLSSASRRVRVDAALTLPRLPDLEVAGPTDRRRMVEALRKSTDREDETLSGLLLAAGRLRLETALEPILTPYLDGRLPHAERLARHVIVQIGPQRAGALLRESVPSDPRGRSRAVELLRAFPAETAEPALRALFQSATDAAAIRACRALLAHGTSSDWIETHGAAEVVAAARQPARRRSAFRAIRPGRTLR